MDSRWRIESVVYEMRAMTGPMSRVCRRCRGSKVEGSGSLLEDEVRETKRRDVD